jgi:hypothetical protein
MKKFFSAALACTITAAILSMFPGCVKDTYQKSYTYTYYVPVYKTHQQVRDEIKSNTPQPVSRPGKIYVRGNYIFLNEIDKGIHVIDNTDPSHPKNIAFIDIPGNMDMAIKGNTLYADLYTDLVAIDITHPAAVTLKKVVDGVFPERVYYSNILLDGSKVVVDWIKRDTVITEKAGMENFVGRRDIFIMYSANSSLQSAASGAASASVSPYGNGGSMARFTLANERLYALNNTSLNVFNVTNEQDPVNTISMNVGMNIETVFPFKNQLLIGSQSGMYVYNISNPDQPIQIGRMGHVESCDPVIADGDYAFVTLRSGRACQGFTNELEVLKLNNITNPSLLKTYPMTNPFGLSKVGNLLFICDGRDGLKVYDATDINNLQLVKQISGLEAYDIITLNDRAILVAKDGLYQYSLSDIQNMVLLSKISLTN